jgi:unconventional prefoldin RPB5 interactor 1
VHNFVRSFFLLFPSCLSTTFFLLQNFDSSVTPISENKMAASNEPLADLERQRLELEGNVRKLRQSLYDWRIREAEYDELKEGVASLEVDCTKDDIIRLGMGLEATVIDEKELKALVGDNPAISRSRAQVIQHISRRLDYVKQNVASLEKRLETVETNLDKILDVERPAPNAADERYAVSEIFEELDEDGNVLSSKVSKPGDQAPDIMEMLQNAGVEVPQNSTKTATTVKEVDVKDQQNVDDTAQHQDTVTTEPEEPAPVDKTDISEEEAQVPTTKTVAKTEDEKTDDLNDSDSEPLISEVDEPVEDAKLRREMLEYGFHEVGKVVAELEMDEEGSDFSYNDDDDFDDDDFENEEDEYGRTTTAVLSEDYHKRMKELEKKLKDGGFINVGPANTVLVEDTKDQIEPSGIMKTTSIKEDIDETQPAKKKTKKKVAFASELDIAEETTPATSERKIEPTKPETTPLSESVVERSSSKPAVNENDKALDAASKKASRFKSARTKGLPSPGDSSSPGLGLRQSTFKTQAPAAPSSLPLFPATPKEPKPFSQPIVVGDIFAKPPPSTQSEPQPPQGKTLAENLVERPAVHKDNALPPDPDEIDDSIHRKEIASDYYRMRNRKIRQSGGFMKEQEDGDDSELYELDENDQPKRRVSKFKAARLRP